MIDALPTRIASKIAADADGCWVWTKCCDQDGYGLVWFDGQMRRAHRIIYEILVGPIPDGLDIDHLCRVRACVNPDHMEPVAHGENIRRGLLGYALRTLCKSGRHDITDPANVYTEPSTGNRKCRTCKNETGRNGDHRRYRATPTTTKDTP